MTRTLITGGAGFIGYHLTRALAADPDHDIDVVDNWFRTRRADDAFEALIKLANVQFMEFDITQPREWDKLDRSYDQIYHLAAVNGTRYFYEIPHEVLRVNLLGVLNALRWLTKGTFPGKLVFASSSEIYAGVNEVGTLPIPTPEDVASAFGDLTNPRISYGVSKLAGELCVRHTAAAHGWRWAIVRYHNVYGPRMGQEHVIAALCERLIRRDNPLKLYGADNRRAFCFIDDAVQATRLVMESDHANGEVVNIGNADEELSILQLVQRCARYAGYLPQIEEMPAPAGSTMRRCPEVSKLFRLTGFRARVGLDEGLAKTYQWYAAQRTVPVPTEIEHQ